MATKYPAWLIKHLKSAGKWDKIQKTIDAEKARWGEGSAYKTAQDKKRAAADKAATEQRESYGAKPKKVTKPKYTPQTEESKASAKRTIAAVKAHNLATIGRRGTPGTPGLKKQTDKVYTPKKKESPAAPGLVTSGTGTWRKDTPSGRIPPKEVPTPPYVPTKSSTTNGKPYVRPKHVISEASKKQFGYRGK